MTDEGSLDLLECALAKAWIAIPRAAVAQVLEYDLSPLPAAARYVGGIGVNGDELFLSIALSASLGTHARRTRGVIVHGPGPTRWCVEVHAVAGFVRGTPAPPTTRDDTLPAWLQRTRLSSGKVGVAIDVPQMIAHLAGSVAR